MSFPINPINIGGTGAPQYAEQNITSIKQNKNSKDVTNPGPANFAEQFTKKPVIDINTTRDDRAHQLVNYGDSGGNTTERVLTRSQILVARGELLKEASLSLNPEHKYDVIATDEPLGYSCNGEWKKLLPKPTDPSCRRVAISEVAWNFNKRGKPFLYKIIERGQIESLPVPGNVVTELSQFYDGGGYAKIWNKPFSPMSDDKYDKLYPLLPSSARGSVNTKVKIYNTAKEPEEVERAEPLLGGLSGFGTGLALGNLISRNQQQTVISTPNGKMICEKVEKKGPTIDQGSKLSFLAQVAAAIKKIFTSPETVSGSIQADLFLPESTVRGLSKYQQHLDNMIPYQDHQKYNFANIPNSSTDGKENYNLKNIVKETFKPLNSGNIGEIARTDTSRSAGPIFGGLGRSKRRVR